MCLKRQISVVLVLCLLLSAVCLPVMAAEGSKQTVTYFEDGSYVVTTITEHRHASLFSAAASKTVSGAKTNDYHSASGDLLYSLTVHGTFTYDGVTATAISASYSYDTHGSGWSFKSGSASCSGATATANATFKYGLRSGSGAVSLTCSPTGVLS